MDQGTVRRPEEECPRRGGHPLTVNAAIEEEQQGLGQAEDRPRRVPPLADAGSEYTESHPREPAAAQRAGRTTDMGLGRPKDPRRSAPHFLLQEALQTLAEHVAAVEKVTAEIMGSSQETDPTRSMPEADENRALAPTLSWARDQAYELTTRLGTIEGELSGLLVA